MISRLLVAGVAAATLLASTSIAQSQSGANVGSLTCNVAGGVGFVFGSSKELSCLFTRTDGKAERYSGSIKKFGIDIGFTKEAQMVWLVFAPGNIAPGALAGSYGGATASGTPCITLSPFLSQTPRTSTCVSLGTFRSARTMTFSFPAAALTSLSCDSALASDALAS